MYAIFLLMREMSRYIVILQSLIHPSRYRLVGTNPKLSNLGIARLIEQVGKAAHNLGFTPGLNPAQWGALRYFETSAPDHKTVTGFANFQGTTKGTASETVSALVKKGLLVRIADKEDKRVHHLMLTQEGQALLKSDPLEELAEAVATVPENERWALAVNMAKVLNKLTRV